MQQVHKVMIVLTLTRQSKLEFDPATHNNYEFIHSFDEYVADRVQDALPKITVPGYTVESVDVDLCIDSELNLTVAENLKAESYNEKERLVFTSNMNKLDAIAKANGIKNSIWSGDATAEEIATKTIEGKVKFVYDSDWNDGSQRYASEVFTDPTYLDAWKAFDKAMEVVNDFHHAFLESFTVVGISDDGVKTIEFSAGS